MHNNYIQKYIPMLGLLLGGIVFCFIYGHKILNPSFIEWTIKGDAAQHFLGWHFFRSEPWQFPLGIIKSYQYPQGTSIVYTDSIPLLAIPLKLLSPLLPPIFQYHGFWLLLCYLLQGYFACLLLKQITDKPILILLAVLFFLLSPVMVQRSGGHEALSGHWLIIASLHLYFQKKALNSEIKWLILLIIALMVHFYLFAMVFLIFSGYLLKQIMEDFKNNWFPAIKLCTITLTISVISMWIIGYFVIDAKYSVSDGFGYYSMNLLSPINSMDTSRFFKTISLATTGQYEGYNYLGFGLILLILISIYELDILHITSKVFSTFLEIIPDKWDYYSNKCQLTNEVCHKLSRQFFFSTTKIYLPLIVIAFILFLISISNKVTFAHIVLFEFNIPYPIDKFFGILRSSGRMFWPVTYMLMLATIAVLVKHNSPQKAVIFLFVFVSIQLLDFSPWYKNINFDKHSWTSPLHSPLWDKLMKISDHIVFIPAIRDQDDYIPFALLAANHGKTINIGSTARTNNKDRNIYKEELLQKFKEGKLINNTLYVVKYGYLYAPRTSSNFIRGILDGYIIIAPKGKEINESELAPWPITIQRNDHKYTFYSLIKKYMVSGYAIFLSVRDEGVSNLPIDFKESMKNIGSNISQLQLRGSYASMIINGKLEVEKISNDAKVDFKYELMNHKINIISAGMPFGNTSIINIDGISLSLNRRGFNVVILNLNDNTIQKYNFDTYQHNNSMMASE